MKALKIFGIFMLIVMALVVISMFVIPHFYKDKIAKIVKTEINKQLTAEADFGKIDLSLFRSFPNFSLGLHDVSVTNLPSDTLMTSDGIYLTVGLFSVLKGDAIEIKSLRFDNPLLNLRINPQGDDNWDVFKESETTESEDTDNDVMEFLLNKVLLDAAKIHFTDKESGFELLIDGLNAFVKGKFSEDRTNLELNIGSGDLTVFYEEIPYLQNIALRFDAMIDANLTDEIYNLKNNTLYLNDLQINFEGSVAFVNDDINLMLVYNTPENSFKQLLSLIPIVYLDGYDKMLTRGQFDLNGYVKGIYSESAFPDFKIEMFATNTEISYPDMPTPVNNIDFSLLIENQGDNLDNTIIRLDNLSANIGKDKLQIKFQLMHPISDPNIDLKATAGIIFENLKNVFPQEYFKELTGEVIADIRLKGSLSSIEKGDYKNFLAMGSLVCNDITYQVKDGYLLFLKHAQFNFSPSQIDIIGFDSKIGGQDILVDGRFNNYLGYFLKDEIFQGKLNMRTTTLDINQLLEPWTATDSGAGSGENSESVIYIPENIDVLVSLTADSVSFDKLAFNNFDSKIHVHDGKIEFEDFNSTFLGGLIHLNGYYEATSDVNPHVDLNLKLMDMRVSTAYQKMSLFSKFTPIAEKAAGIFDASLNLNLDLDENMNPVWSSILGNGNFASDDIELMANEIFSRISDVLKIDLFENPSTGPIDLSFKLMDGKIFHKPFTVTLNDIQMEIGGWTGFDQHIDYNLAMNIPVKLLGNNVSKVMEHYANEIGKLGLKLGDIQTLKPVLKVDGLVTSPNVTLVSLGNITGSNIKDIVKDKVDEVIDGYLEEANKEADRILAEAQREADSIIAAAQQQVGNVMKLANQTISNLKNEVQKQSEQLVKEAAKQGPLAELAANKAAKELLKRADVEADKTLLKAQQESDKIMENARKQSEATMQRALKKADIIRKK